SSPKDMANASLYSDATSKAKYLAATYYPEVDPLSTTADSIATDNITGTGIPNSINTLLKRITADSDLLNDLEHSSISDLVPSELASLLDVLNDCDWTYDAVPNAVALTIDEVSLDDVKFSRSNPYYAYYYDIAFDEGSGSFVKDPDAPRLLTPTFLNHYDNEEINRLAETIGLINGDPSALTEFSSKASITKVRDILNGLNESFIFSKDGACYLLEPDDSPAETKTDLSVFEQAMYKVFKDSTLASLSYNETIDSSYFDSEAKLLSKIKNFPSDKWGDELAAMLINDAQDSGLLCKAFDLGLISGSSVSVDANTLESLSPSEIAEILYAVNDVDMIRDIIPLQASEFLSNKLHFNNYSGAKVAYTPNAMSFALPVSTPVNSLTITYSGANTPVVSYLKAGALYSVTPNTISSGVNEYIINDGSSMTDIVLGHMISVTCDGNMSKVEVAFDTNAIIGMNKARLDTYDAVADTHKGAINSFIGLIEKLYDGTGYIDIGSDPSAIGALFNTPGNLTALSNFAKNGDSIYTRVYNASNEEAMSGVYTGGDVVLSNLLSFENGGATVNLAKYLPNYDPNDKISVYKDIYTIFVGSNPNSLTSEEIADVTEWLDSNVMDVASLYVEYEMTKDSYGMRAVSMGADSVHSASGKSISEYITLSSGHTWNTFEAKFKAGFGRVFYEDMKAYAQGANYFTNNLSSTNFHPNANNYEHFITLMKESILPLLANIKPAGFGGVTSKPMVASIFEDFGLNYQSLPDADVVVAFYEGTIYEFLAGNYSSTIGTQPSSHGTPWGSNGYFAHAASVVSA
ncbi:MAG: hypothetical protein K6G74_03065, partial [Bacilli bacterium]|nr:hypothetical protein [Bacilli bacterium]